MSDTLICNYPLPDNFRGTLYLTRDFESIGDTYKIDDIGQLWLSIVQEQDDEGRPIGPRGEHLRWERQMHNGLITFEGGYDGGDYREYEVRYNNGEITELRLARERDDLLDPIERRQAASGIDLSLDV